LTQERLAEKADLTPKYFGEVERGLVNVSVDALARIARAVGACKRREDEWAGAADARRISPVGSAAAD
jgi:transcriptional regulator with XRE-family HTH domain